MKPYTITFSRKGKPDQTYTILAHDRNDAIAFTKRVHTLDFGKVISCRPTKIVHLEEVSDAA